MCRTPAFWPAVPPKLVRSSLIAVYETKPTYLTSFQWIQPGVRKGLVHPSNSQQSTQHLSEIKWVIRISTCVFLDFGPIWSKPKVMVGDLVGQGTHYQPKIFLLIPIPLESYFIQHTQNNLIVRKFKVLRLSKMYLLYS